MAKSIDNRQSALGNVMAGMARLELANQLIENQPAFHFAFIPRKNKKRLRLRRLKTTLRGLQIALQAILPSTSTKPRER